jgi:hypothetical protein
MEIKTLYNLEFGMKMLMIFGATYGVQQDSEVKEHMGHSLVQLQHLLFSNGYGVQVTLGNIDSFSGSFLETD